MITSFSNSKMKDIIQLNKKSKTRYERRVFVVEGIKMCMESPKDQIEAMYVSESFLSNPENRKLIEGREYETVSDGVFSHVSDTKTPQGILCLVKMPEYKLQDLLGKSSSMVCAEKREEQRTQPHLLILESIQDPGNLGTMMRTGEGAGITGVIMNRETVDLFHPKTIRSTMGSLFRVPFYITENLRETVIALREQGIAMYAAHLKGRMLYDQADYTTPCGFLIGNEGNGLSRETADLADAYIRIPMEGSVESLNAAAASAILMYEVNRQRSKVCKRY